MASLFRSSTTLRPPLRIAFSKSSNLLPLPSLLRSRAFHATAPRPIYQETVETTHFLLTSLHNLTHTPWALTLPLVALLLRGAIILPITLRQRAATRQQLELAPVLQAWKYALTVQAQREVGHLGQGHVERQVLSDMRRKRKEIYARYGCGAWRNYLGLAQLPVFLGVMETLRLMVGAKEGLLGMISKFWTSNGETVAPGGEGEGEGIEAVVTSDGLANNLNIPIETTMSTEGLLWFPNLLIPDPQLILPFLLSGTILLNIYAGPSLGAPGTQALGKWQKNFRRGMGATALFIGPAMLGFPSAMLVYWISSSGLNFVQMWALHWWDPIQRPVRFITPKKPWRSGVGRMVKA